MRVFVAFFALFALLEPFTMAEDAAPAPAELQQVLQGNSNFANKLYNVLAEKEGNLIFSPISAHTVLALTYQGAQGITAEHLSSTLGLPDQKATAVGYEGVIDRLNNVPNVTLLTANKVYLQEGKVLLAPFSQVVKEHFKSEVQLLNFKENEVAAKTINEWVEEKTKDKIKDLIQKDDLTEWTRLVLVNAIYFKGNWEHKFNPQLTKTEPFYLNENDKVDVQMMHIKKRFGYKNDPELDAQVLELPYTNKDISMVIILPNKKDGIKGLEEKLKTTNLNEIIKGTWTTEVNVALPKFKIEQTIDLKDALTKVGLGNIFSENEANFKGMIELRPDENLYVSKVVQKAFIEVNEEGAEAAAATGVLMAVPFSNVIIRNRFYFIADHPFVYALFDKSLPLFVGRMSKV